MGAGRGQSRFGGPGRDRGRGAKLEGAIVKLAQGGARAVVVEAGTAHARAAPRRGSRRAHARRVCVVMLCEKGPGEGGKA